jgi:hypothetical protein
MTHILILLHMILFLKITEISINVYIKNIRNNFNEYSPSNFLLIQLTREFGFCQFKLDFILSFEKLEFEFRFIRDLIGSPKHEVDVQSF